ncbi:MAG: hypothetical protein IPK82_01580 [Polyangiaceae bacterium]|nr:hypothetical protein [Polyangiaceae bacterium]
MKRTIGGLPESVRYVPAYLNACRRLEGKEGPHPVGKWMERLAMLGLEKG